MLCEFHKCWNMTWFILLRIFYIQPQLGNIPLYKIIFRPQRITAAVLACQEWKSSLGGMGFATHIRGRGYNKILISGQNIVTMVPLSHPQPKYFNLISRVWDMGSLRGPTLLIASTAQLELSQKMCAVFTHLANVEWNSWTTNTKWWEMKERNEGLLENIFNLSENCLAKVNQTLI